MKSISINGKHISDRIGVAKITPTWGCSKQGKRKEHSQQSRNSSHRGPEAPLDLGYLRDGRLKKRAFRLLEEECKGAE